MLGGDRTVPNFSKNILPPIQTKRIKPKKSKNNATKKKVSSVDSVESKNSQKRKERKENLESGKTDISPLTPDNKKKLFIWEQMHEVGAGDAFKYVYGFSPNVIHSDSENTINMTTARDWWEHTGPQTQCANAIMPIVWGKTICYICGEKLLQNESSPECEHILPISKAAIYLTLYRSEYKTIMEKGFTNSITDENEQRVFNEISMEYDWSHRCCNQKKNDTDFIKYNTKKDKFEIDVRNTTSVLKQIIKGSLDKDGHCKENSLNTKFSKMNNKDIKKWIDERIDILNAKQKGKIRVICDYLNEYKAKSKSLFNIINLATLISSADMNKIHSVWRNIEGNPPIKKLPPIVQITKAKVIDDITQLSSQIIKNFNWGRDLKIGRVNIENNLIRYIFSIYPTINSNEEITKGIYGTYVYINETQEQVSDFFMVLYSLVIYPLNSISPLLYGTSNKSEIGKIYASNMVAHALKIIFYSLIIINIEDSKRQFNISSINTLAKIEGFKDKFNKELEKELDELIENYDNYMVEVSIKEDNPNYFNIYTDFMLLFLKLTEGISLYSNTSDVKTFLNPIIERKNVEKGITMEPKDEYVNSLISNKEKAIVAFILDESENLKKLNEWNPEIKTETDLISEANGVAVGTSSLLEIKNQKIEDWLYIEEIGDAIGLYSDENIKRVKNEMIQEINDNYADYKNDNIIPFIQKELDIDEVILDTDIDNKLLELDIETLNDLINILKDIQEIDDVADILTNIKESENKSEVSMDVDIPETDIDAAQALLGLQNIETLPSKPPRKLKRTFMELDENPNKRIRKGGTKKSKRNRTKKNRTKRNQTLARKLSEVRKISML